MAATKYRKGELNFIEGNTTIKDLLKTFATGLTKQQWVSYDNNEQDKAWAFDIKREIWLREAFDPTNIKLYKATLGLNGEYSKGDEIPNTEYMFIKNVIRGINDTADNGTQINDRVLIEVIYNDNVYEQSCILDTVLPSGQALPHAVLKGRPQGDITVFEEEIQQYTKEPLHQEGGNEIYKFAMSPISPAKDQAYTVAIYKNGVEVNKEDYVIDYWNGLVLFNTPLTDSDKVTATYGYKTGVRKNKIENTKYKRNKNRIIDITTSKELVNKDIIVDVNYFWELAFPTSIGGIADRILLQTKVDISENGDRYKLKTYYVEMQYIDYEQGNESAEYRTGIKVRFGSVLDAEKELEGQKTLDDKSSSHWAKFSWYKNNCFDAGVVFEDWLPIKFAINHTKEFMNIFIQGDNSPDFGQDETHYLMSHAYFGMLEQFENYETEDLKNNFAMTVSSGEAPNLELATWGVGTGNGVTDVVMERTASNIPMQGHYVSIQTTPEFLEKQFINASKFTGCHHFSRIVVTHPSERERGMLQGLLYGDTSAMFHFDELTHDKDEFDLRGALTQAKEIKDKYGFPFESKETKWLHVNTNAPYSFKNNSSNTLYNLAMRKE